MVDMLWVCKICGAGKVAMNVPGSRARAGMAGLARWWLVEVERHGDVRECGDGVRERVGDEFRAWRNE